jgi:hypothetical protein
VLLGYAAEATEHCRFGVHSGSLRIGLESADEGTGQLAIGSELEQPTHLRKASLIRHTHRDRKARQLPCYCLELIISLLSAAAADSDLVHLLVGIPQIWAVFWLMAEGKSSIGYAATS